jgi:adenosylmethionine-8-amino-7-oxononanoate aminotransferase
VHRPRRGGARYEGPESVAAILVEPVVGTNGAFWGPPEYLPRLREICDRHGILLIADEVLTGFGRTGRWFGFEHFGIVPDIVTMGKAITSGHAPLGAVALRDSVARTSTRNPLVTGSRTPRTRSPSPRRSPRSR